MRISAWVLAALALAWLVARFVKLDNTPPGFWSDEAWDAAQALCLSETGHDADDRPWSLFSRALGGGTLPVTWSAFQVLWLHLFGTSIGAFRAAAAFWNLLTCLGLFALARLACRFAAASVANDDPDASALRTFPLAVVLAALLSPWSFQFSRISWEGPIAPAFLILSLAALVRLWLTEKLRWPIWAAASGAMAALAMISYPPLRVATPPILAMAAVLMTIVCPSRRTRWRFAGRVLVASVVFAVSILPVVVMTIRGEIISRTMGVAIFAPDWLDRNRGTVGRVPFFLVTLVNNLFVHLRPSYLFFSGDVNTRHSAQLVGQLSPIDILALVMALAILARILWLATQQMAGSKPVSWPRIAGTGRLLLVLGGFAIAASFFATLPAALTWEGVPHALRSIGT